MLQRHGSGKTAVLVERIIQKIIKDKVDIDKILVVTFTSAAASEMRERILEAIYKKMEQNPDDENLQRQLILLNKASICTIDSFCLDVIRNNFYELDISANARVADSTEILLLKQEVLDDIFEEKYISNDKDFISLIETYTKYNKDEELKDIILKIYSYIQSSPFPEKWLEKKTNLLNIEKETNFANTIWGKIIINNIDSTLKNSILKLRNILEKMQRFPELEKFTSVIEQDIENYTIIEQNLDDWDKAYTLINDLKLKNWPVDKKVTNDLKDEAKEVRESVKAEFKKVKELINCSSEEAISDISYMYNILTKLKDLILDFSTKFYDKKREKNIMDFNDMEHLALKMLVKEDNGKLERTDIAEKYQNKFEEIAIDEYQDSNLVQEYILTSISTGNNIFMVGDVKQSIYKFRQARPELFLEKYNKYSLEPQENEDRKIQLFKNFRSRKNILDFTNLVFENIMSKEIGNIDYNNTEYLNLGANFEQIENQNLNTEIEILDLTNEEENIWKESENEEEEPERVEEVVLEARFVAQKIKKLIEDKYQIIDKKEGKRNVQYKDICILLRSITGIANVYEKEISEIGIPVYSDSSGEYLQSIEIETVMALLKVINNPMQDIPLVTLMRSPIGNFTDNELIEIRMNDRNSTMYEALLKADTEKAKSFLNLLENLRNDEETMTLDEWIWNIYNKTGYMNYVSLMPNGNLRVSNLKMLFERAKQFETASFKGLFNFINYIDKIKFNSEDLSSAKVIGENENVVRIMSIHKSKGLEFPVVILAGTGKQFNMQDLNEKILLDQDLGLGPQYIDNTRHIEFKTVAKKALSIKAKDEAISEEMRVLYVALTRAKEKLIIVGRQKEVNKKMQEKNKLVEIYKKERKLNPYLLKKYKTYLDWFELIYAKEGYEKTKDIFTVNVTSRKDLMKIATTEERIENNAMEKIEELAKSCKNENEEQINQVLNWEYLYKDLNKIPTKTSVTKIKEMQNIEDIQENTKKINFVIDADDEQEPNKQYPNKQYSSKQYPNKQYSNKQYPNDKAKEKNYVGTITAKPKFLNNEKETRITNAEKGTLMHLCVQRLQENCEYTVENIKEFTEELQEKGLITELEKSAINIEKLYEYTKSELWQNLKNAKEIYKEQPFYINIKASSLYDNIPKEADENILVQGIIDLFYKDKNDNIILVDYKTDFIQKGNEQSLADKYQKQLELYKKAIEISSKNIVKETYIYSLYLNELIKLEI